MVFKLKFGGDKRGAANSPRALAPQGQDAAAARMPLKQL